MGSKWSVDEIPVYSVELILESFSLLVEQILYLLRAESGGTWPLSTAARTAFKSSGSYSNFVQDEPFILHD